MANPAVRGQKVCWVVVADEARALVYGRDTRTGPHVEILSLANEAGRKKAADLVCGRGGRSFGSSGKGRHAMTNEKSDPKSHAAEVFAREIAARISNVIHDGSCRGYSLVAAPRFLGMLRNALSTNCKVEALTSVDKDLVGHPEADIKKAVDGK